MRATPAGEFLVRQVDIGWSVYERAPDDSDYDPRGGTVIAMDDRVDTETGEIVRWFRTLRFTAGQPGHVDLSEHSINPDAIALPNAAVIRSAVRRLAELRGRRRGTLTSDELEWLDVELRLARSIG